jgi:peptidoglycan-associated lipoprotein
MNKWKLVVIPIVIMGLMLSACPPKQVPEIDDAQAAIAAAQAADAGQYSPTKLKAAQEALAAAEAARKKKNYAEAVAQAKLAQKLAQEARQEAIAAAPRPAPTQVVEAAQPVEAASTAEGGVDYSQIFKTVYFDFDKSDIKSDFRAGLDSAAKYLTEHANLKITVTGHCDPRGTDEYNMALGERRARAVKQYLVNAGVAADRINVVSKGESELLDPSCQAEDCWAKERRGIFSVR